MHTKEKVFVLCLLLVGIGCQNQQIQNPHDQRDGIFIHVSHGSEDAHRVLMALKMAEIMSETQDVLLYFDIQGVEVLLKDAPDLRYSHFPSSHTQIKALLAKGVTIVACPGCLKAAGKTPDDVMPGVQIASKEAFFQFTKGRILTLDY